MMVNVSEFIKENPYEKDITIDFEKPKEKLTNVSDFIKKNPYEKDITIDFDDDKELDIGIVDLFKDCNPTETSSAYKMECPDCGLQGGRTEGFILFPDNNSAYCQSSGKHFRFLEAYALKKRIIKCLDGRETGGDASAKILAGELFTSTLEEFRNEFGVDIYDKMSDQLNIKSSIELPGDDRYQSTFSNKLVEVYESRNILFFKSDAKEVVEIRRYKIITKNGGEKFVETGFEKVTPGRLVTLIELLTNPWTWRYSKDGGKKTVKKSMTPTTSGIVLESSNFQNMLPSINRIFEIPIPCIHENKIVFPKKGYDKRFGSWLISNSPEIIDKEMSLEEAKENINTIFEEFCFAGEKDKIHAIAGFLTPFLHGLLPQFYTRTPVFIYMANRERAGKDYCAGCTGILYEGCKTEQPAICNDEVGSNNAELQKKITACMRQGKKRFHSANNKGLLNNSIFEGVTTAETWEDRILGKTKVLKFNNEMDYSLSGNLGIRLTPDMSNRARIVNLHLVDEDANARKFKNPDLHGWMHENRELILSSLYTLVRNWVENGRKPGTIPFASFPEWASTCGGIMEAAGYENPCKPDKTAIISLDSETEEMKLLFEVSHQLHADEWLTKKQIQDIVENEGLMDYLDLNEKADKIKFGLKIDKFSRRVLSDIFMDVDNIEQRGSRRKYKFTKKSNHLIRKEGSIGSEGVVNNISKTIDNKTSFSEHDMKIKDLVKNGEKDGIVGKVGIVDYLVPVSPIGKYRSIGGSMPTLPTIPFSDISKKVPQEMEGEEKLLNSEKMSKKTKQLKATKIEREKPVKKEKTDRELQFFESPECENIIEQCTKDQVYKWIELNQNIGFEKMYDKLGNGCLKHVGDLMKENKVKAIGDNWEVMTNAIIEE